MIAKELKEIVAEMPDEARVEVNFAPEGAWDPKWESPLPKQIRCVLEPMSVRRMEESCTAMDQKARS